MVTGLKSDVDQTVMVLCQYMAYNDEWRLLTTDTPVRHVNREYAEADSTLGRRGTV
jgi:hypothetical protein